MSIKGALGKLCWYRKVLQEHSGGCAGTAEYYRSTRQAVLVQESTIEALERLCRYRRILKEHLGGSIGTAEYYRSNRQTVLVQQRTIGTLGGCVGTAEYYRAREVVLVQQNTLGHGRLCWYSRILQKHSVGFVSTAEYYRSTRDAVLVQK